MPRHVDRDTRRVEILSAAFDLLSENGPRGLTFRTIAERLGGSVTLVTHYYSNRQALLDDLVAFTTERWREELEEIETGIDDPRHRLLILLEFLVPMSKQGLLEERGRITLLAERPHTEEATRLAESWDDYLTGLIRAHLKHLVPAKEVDGTARLLRVLTNGLTLSALEHPDRWPAKSQLKVVEDQLELLSLGAGNASKSKRASTRPKRVSRKANLT